MLPAPSTIATSTPRSWMTLISWATALSRSGSVPKSREPMRDSPDSFSRIRRKAGASSATDWLLADREAREAPDLDVLAGLGADVVEQLADGLAVVLVAVDVRLVEQHDRLV